MAEYRDAFPYEEMLQSSDSPRSPTTVKANAARNNASSIRWAPLASTIATVIAGARRRVERPRGESWLMKICIVSSCGGHLTEVRCLKPAYESYQHFYVLNDK